MTTSLYQSIVLEHNRTPLHAGRPVVFDAHGNSENRMCGDEVSVFFTQEGLVWRHEAQGCAILTASADLMCASLHGVDVASIPPLYEQFERLVKTGQTNPDLGDLNALASIAHYPVRLRCATLPWGAVRNAIATLPGGSIGHG